MTVRVCCSLIAVLLCLCVYLSTTDAEEAARANRSVRLAARLSEPEKPGVCPRKNLEVVVSEVCVGSCSRDSDCPNDQKCCSNGCERQCVDPYKAGPAKPGVCPKNNAEVAVSGVCAEMCSHDSDCPKDQKCCSNGCGHKCVAPYKEPAKPGVCPRNNVEDAMLRPCVESCSHDRDCPKDQKCCSSGCGHQCMAPYKGPAKPGVCPKSNVGVCAEMCSHDRDCPKDQKCCSNGCGRQCMPPYKEKPGVCPRRFVGEGLCKKLCASDIDCPDDQKCCRTKCGRECTSPF